MIDFVSLAADLDSSDVYKRRNAQAYLGLDVEPAPFPPMLANVRPRPPGPQFQSSGYAQVRLCLYRETKCGCQAPRCWAGYGDLDEPDGRSLSTLANCLRCLRP